MLVYIVCADLHWNIYFVTQAVGASIRIFDLLDRKPTVSNSGGLTMNQLSGSKSLGRSWLSLEIIAHCQSMAGWSAAGISFQNVLL